MPTGVPPIPIGLTCPAGPHRLPAPHANGERESPLPMPEMTSDPLGTRRAFPLPGGGTGQLFSLPELEKKGFGRVSRLPVTLRIVLESLLRNLDGLKIKEEDVRALAGWLPRTERTAEIPFVVARIVLQDFTGVP